jgi:hypothetical protein
MQLCQASSRRWIRPAVVLLAPVLFVSTAVWAGNGSTGLQEDEVMLLYTSGISDSAQVAAAYLSLHPTVIPCDLGLTYPVLRLPSEQTSTPPAGGINNQFITRAQFRALFLDVETSPFRQCLAKNPQILAIVTTRGLPAAVSDNFNPGPSQQPAQGGIWCSLESALTVAGQGAAVNPFSFQWIQNPFRGAHGLTFREFLEQPGDDFEIGDIFLVTRIDAHDPDGPCEPNCIDGECVSGCSTPVHDMLERVAAAPPVNTFAVTVLIDATSQADIDSGFMRAAGMRLFDHGWCVLTDTTCNLVEGVEDPYFDANDAPVSDRPFIAILSKGTGGNDPTDHTGCEGPANWWASYLLFYQTHPMGIWFAEDSGAAFTLHSPNEYAFAQGQIDDWISGGGSFGIGTVREPGTFAIEPADIVGAFLNLGLSWAESYYAGISYLTPSAFVTLGDPLARVTVYRPDIVGANGAPAREPLVCDVALNRVVDACDEIQVLNNLSGPGRTGDIDGDGTVDEDDLAQIHAPGVFGRNCSAPPTAFVECGEARCPDFDPDFIINVADLLALLARWGPCPVLEYAGVPCHGDFNGNCEIGVPELLEVLARWGTHLLDTNRDGLVNCDDVAHTCAVLEACVAMDLNCDITCDDAVTQLDLILLQEAVPGCQTCKGCP